MKYFLYKLIPPRPTFAQDMTEAEAKLMQEHATYWRDLVDKGNVIIFGPVLDPKGTWGVAIIEAENEDDVHSLGINDPIIKADLNFRFETYSMPEIVLRK